LPVTDHGTGPSPSLTASPAPAENTLALRGAS
jgi:hypothetical protein